MSLSQPVSSALFIKQADSRVLFSSVSKEVKGRNKCKQAAITKCAISKIPVNDVQFQAFIKQVKAAELFSIMKTNA